MQKQVEPEAVVVEAATTDKAASKHNFLDITVDGNVGNVSIAPNVVAHIIRKNVLAVEGVARFAPRGLGDLVNVFSERAYDSSMNISFKENGIDLTLALIIYYGYNVKEVCNNVQKRLQEQVLALIGTNVGRIDVLVKDLVEPEEVTEEEAAEEQAEAPADNSL